MWETDFVRRRRGLLSLRDPTVGPLQSGHPAKPDYAPIGTFDYYFTDEDGSVYVVETPGLLNFWGSPKKKYVAGPKEGTTVDITPEEVAEHQQKAENKWGRYIPGGLFRQPRFMPGTHRKQLPIYGPRGIEGWVDENGVHYYSFREFLESQA